MENNPGFRYASSRLQIDALTSKSIETALGKMIAISDEKALLLLEFADRSELDWEIDRIEKLAQTSIKSGITKPIASIEKELALYFSHQLKTFTTPIQMIGTSFQQQVWHSLLTIPYGTTTTYQTIAHSINKPTACRAVGHANGSNQLAIIVPCHRVVSSRGNLTGYAGGLKRKQTLLEHEQQASL